MPKIPLYNQGLGSAIDVKPVQSVRANEGAFTAAQKGFTALGETIQDVSFKFGMMEKQQETERKTNEEATRLRDAADNFNMSNQDTDTESFVNNFKKFQTEQMASVEKNIANLTRTQKESVRNSLNNIFSSKMAAGKQQAWGKGLSMKKTAVDAELESLARDISMISKESPLRNIRISEANEKIKQSQVGGYTSKFSEATFMSTIIGSDYASEIQLAKTPAEVKAIRERASQDKALSSGQFEKIVSATNSREAQTEVEQFENIVGVLAEASDEVSKSDLDTAKQKIMNNQPFTIGGTTYVTDEMGLSGPNRIKLANVVDTLGKDKFDAVANNAVSTLNNSISQNDENVVLSDVSNMYNKDIMAKTGVTEDQVDGFVIESAQQNVDEIVRQIDSGEITNIPAAIKQLDKVETILKTDTSGRGALFARTGSVGDSSDTILKAAAKARKDINKAVGDSANLTIGKTYFQAGKFPSIDQSGYTPKQVQAIIASSLKDTEGNPIPVSQQLTLLETNDVEFKMFSQSLGQGRAIGLAGGFVTTENAGAPEGIKGDTAEQSEGFKIVEQNLQLYRLMERYPSVLTNHTTEDDRAFYDAVIDRLGYESLETAINNVSQANRLKIDVKPKYKQVSEKVDEITKSAAEASWFTSLFTDTPTKVLNSAYVTSELQKRTEQRIQLGSDPKAALDAAVKDMTRTHAFIHGTFVKMGMNMPSNIQNLADMAIDDAMKRHPYLSETGIEKEELSIIQYGDPNNWAVVLNGSQPAEDREGKVILYTTEQLNTLFDKDYQKKADEIRSKVNKLVENRKNAMLNYYDMPSPDDLMLIQEGKGIYDGVTVREWFDKTFDTPANDFEEVPDIVKRSSMYRMRSTSARQFGAGKRFNELGNQ